MVSIPFFRLPTLGGLLSILNCAAWCGLTYAQFRDFHVTGIAGAFVWFGLTLPFGWIAVFPQRTCGAGGGKEEFVAMCIMLSANSFAWGYGLAAIWRKVVSRFRRKKFHTEGSAISN